jgi:DNA-binding CsgD family transcriptional regulator
LIKDKREFERLADLIDRVYEAALDEDEWGGIADDIARTFDSTSTTLQIQRSDSAHILSMTDNVLTGLDDYRSYFWQKDIWVERARTRLGPSRVGSSGDMVSDAEFQESEFYRDWCRHLGVFYVVGALFPSGGSDVGVLGIHRPRAAGNYDAADKWCVSRFLPHVQRAMRVRYQLRRAALGRRMSLHVLERAETAIFLLGADASIVFANPLAEALMTRRAGVCCSKGRLAAADPTDAPRLTACIRAACISAGGDAAEGMMTLQRGSKRPLTVLVAPFRQSLPGSPSVSAIMFIRDPCKAVSVTNGLRSLFQLTVAEARIAEALINGKSAAQIARESGARIQTVRKQIKSILAKTGTRRQADCVALILRTVAPLSAQA